MIREQAPGQSAPSGPPVSWQATSWALNTDLEPVSKILLIAYADFASEGGTGACDLTSSPA